VRPAPRRRGVRTSPDRTNTPRGGESTQSRQADIEQNQVGPQLFRALNGIQSVGGCDHAILDPLLQFATDELAELDEVLGKEDGDL
jgi:hypothetical protein